MDSTIEVAPLFTDRDKVAAAFMLSELRSMKLEVCKLETDGNAIRVVVCPNPDWYSRLCEQHKAMRLNRRWKRPRTIIRRVQVTRTLERIIAGHAPRGLHGERLMDAIKFYRERMQDDDSDSREAEENQDEHGPEQVSGTHGQSFVGPDF